MPTKNSNTTSDKSPTGVARRSPVEFLDCDVLPALFERLDQAFPEFGWERTNRGWSATNREYTKGSFDARPNRVVCNKPFGFLVHGGSSMSWIAHINGGDSPRGRVFIDCVRKLADLAGVDASALDRQLTPEEESKLDEANRRTELLEAFAAYTQHVLRSSAGKNARDYLIRDRGFIEDGITELPFGLYTTQAKVKEHLTLLGFKVEEVEASGVISDGRWKGRLICPERDPWGKLATFWARDISGKAETADKYLYLKGGKKPVAFGLYAADRAGTATEDLILLEGVIDKEGLHARGVTNVAAIGGAGTQFTAKRWEALARLGIRQVTLALDNDDAGQKGTLAAIENASKASVAPVVYAVPPEELGDSKDPDEFIRAHGVEKFREVLDKRLPGDVHQAQIILRDVTPESPVLERRQAVDKILAIDSVLRGDQTALNREDILRTTVDSTGYTYPGLSELADDHTARRQREESERDLAALLGESQRKLSGKEDVFEVTQELKTGLYAIEPRGEQPPLQFSVDRLDQESAETPLGKRSGWEALDRQDVYFNPGELAIIAGRTGHAKTAVLVGLIINWLLNEDENVADELIVFYSFEEPEVRIYHRLLSVLTAKEGSGWTTNEIRDYLRDPYSRASWSSPDALDRARNRLRGWEGHLQIVWRPDWSVTQIETHAHNLARQHKLGAVLVDYLQRVPPPESTKFERRDQQISAVGRQLKTLSIDLSIPVVCGAQINRESIPTNYHKNLAGKTYEDAKNVIKTARPDLHHLREGGSEQEADLVLAMLNYAADYRRDEGKRLPDVTHLEIAPLKNRYGGPGRWAQVAFEGRFGLIRDEESSWEA